MPAFDGYLLSFWRWKCCVHAFNHLMTKDTRPMLAAKSVTFLWLKLSVLFVK